MCFENEWENEFQVFSQFHKLDCCNWICNIVLTFITVLFAICDCEKKPYQFNFLLIDN